ncbi:heavy metal sensor histidine kinase [Aliiglaciecola sp. CAU 1673]|uniref:heavy metal sensor histidine kinase n=1 Tax=Aliiglaciecola sp. CAU 1673 TaxID=3032595 RepID=UPI0023DA1DB4|nr:heavy metal sensor histidine kinase [Aliiglaciecola sp. CAU 1673]MDF2179876.1 heavy metal sensor histidine kinase [Aliiglaciecola sp. CAU 1673]
MAKSGALSLAGRMLLLVGSALLLCFIFLGLVIDKQVKDHFRQQDLEELLVVRDSVQKILNDFDQYEPRSKLEGALSNAVIGHHGMFYGVFDEQNQLIYRNHDIAFAPFQGLSVDSLEPPETKTWKEHDLHLRGVHREVQLPWGQKGKVLLARNIGFHMQFLKDLHHALWGTLILVWLLTLAIGWLAIHFGLQPLRHLTRQIGNVNTDKLHLRLEPGRVPVELSPLVQSFNRMISEVESGFRRLSSFSADIAHELRTPLTALAMQTQVSLSQARTSDEYQEILYSNLEEIERLITMVNDMLWLAKTDNGLVQLDLRPLILADEVDKLIEYLGLLADEKGVHIKRIGNCQFEGDKGMLQRALSNLLSNAIRHARPNSIVQVELLESDGQVAIVVINQGDVIEKQQLAHLFDRFYQVDPARKRQTEGSGLGLALVKSIVELHQGTISVESDTDKTKFRLVFPKA